MSYDEPADPAPDPLAQGADLVRELVRVIEELTYADADGRFTAIRECVDVADDVDPVLAAAQAYLASLPTAQANRKEPRHDRTPIPVALDPCPAG